MFLEVSHAEYLDGYRLKLTFNNGQVRLVDLQSSLNGVIFEPLKQLDFFKRFSIKFNTIEWENGADFAPEYLYEISTPIPYDLDQNEPPKQVADDSSIS